MDLAARIEPRDGDLSNLVGKSEVSMSGKAAAFGGRMMSSVADQILKQFAANFATQVSAVSAASPATAPSTGADRRTTDPPSISPDSESSASAAQPPASAVPVAPPAARELDGLALAWAVLKDWLRSLFGKAA